MFSVIIPLYNKAKYIKKTIQSVLNQTFRNFELIIINDGSTDDSLQIVENISDNRTRIINKPNGGVSSARNLGIKIARYNYIALLDADDLWMPNYLEEMYNMIHLYPNDSFFGSNFLFIKNELIIKSKVQVNLEAGKCGYIDYYESFYKAKYSPICSSAVVFNKRLFNQFKFRENLKSGEDILLWMQFALHNKLVYLNIELAYYNHDVDVLSRALGKLYKKENTYLFFLDEFEEEAQINLRLKHLIDFLRSTNLKPYISLYPDEVKSILSKVSKLDFIHWIYYHLPSFILKHLYKR